MTEIKKKYSKRTIHNQENLENEGIEPLKLLERRRKRIPLIEQRRIAYIPNLDPNFKYKWVNDTTNRLYRYSTAGYCCVDKEKGVDIDIDERIQDPSWRQSVISQDGGNGIKTYLMRTPKKTWEEDQKLKREKINKMVEEIDITQRSQLQNSYGEIKIS